MIRLMLDVYAGAGCIMTIIDKIVSNLVIV